MIQKKWLNYFKNVLIQTSKLSTCASKQVGCILVKDNRILAISYNGVLPKQEHCNTVFNSEQINNNKQKRQQHHKWSHYNQIHAQQNLLMYCAKNGIITNDTEMYITLTPCIDCAKLIASSGIKKVFYLNQYDKQNGLCILNKSGIEFYNINQYLNKSEENK